MQKTAILLAMSALPWLALAQERLDPGQTVVAHGEAVVDARPDRARLQIGVMTQAATAQAAGVQNAKQTADVIAELKRMLGTDASIRTVNYSLYPNYSAPKEGRPPVISGYNANNTVEVQTDDLTLVGKIVDGVTKTGANNIHSIQFLLRDEQKARADALQRAATQAKSNAEALAGALGMRIKRILRVEDSGATPIIPLRQMEMGRMAMADAAPTPMEPGTIQIRATVRVTADVAP